MYLFVYSVNEVNESINSFNHLTICSLRFKTEKYRGRPFGYQLTCMIECTCCSPYYQCYHFYRGPVSRQVRLFSEEERPEAFFSPKVRD